MAISIRTKDYRSDIVLTLHMTLGGETVNVQQHDFLLRFFTEHEARHYDCGRIKGEWLHCAPDESDTTLLTCYIKNHGLGCGMLQCLYIDLSPNDGMEDGVQRTFSVSGIDLELVDDASDDTQAVSGEVVIDLNAVLSDLHDAADAAEASRLKNIASITYQQSTADGGTNLLTITQNNGTANTFPIKNGSKGSTGATELVFGSMSNGIFYDINGHEATRSETVLYIDRSTGKIYRWGLNSYVEVSGIGTVDLAPTSGSANLVTSGGVYAAIQEGKDVIVGYINAAHTQFVDLFDNVITPQDGKLYVDASENRIYKWSGSGLYVEVSVSGLDKYTLDNAPFLENPNTSTPDVFNIYKTYADYRAWLSDHQTSHLMSVAELLAYLEANIGQYVLAIDAASSPEYVQRLSVAGGIAGQSSATTYIELRSYENAPGLKISFSIDRTATNTGTTLTAERSTGLSTASYNGNTKVNEVSIAPAGVLTKLANGTTTTYNLPSSSGTIALTSDIAGARPMRVTATWDASASAYTYESAVDVDTMYQSFYSQGKVLELHLVNGNYNGLVLTCHGGYTSNNERHLKFSGSGDGKLIEADVVGTAVTVSYEDINEISRALYGKQDKTLVTSTIPVTGLLPNVVYNFGTTDSVSVTLAAGETGVANIWCFVFTAQSAACTVTLPSSVVLGNEYAWDMVAGRKFEVSIMNGIAIVNYVD